MSPEEVVITGVGVICPIGIGNDEFWQSLCAGRSGVRPIRHFDASALPVKIAAEVIGFEPKRYIKQRKSLKIMSRDAQLGVAASELACQDAGIVSGTVDPERFGVVLAADSICPPIDEAVLPYHICMKGGVFDFRRWREGMAAGYPLAFLRICPNMLASHTSIAHDARGPNNTIHQNQVSGLLAISEAARIIERGVADVMLAGGASSRMTPTDWARHCVMQPLAGRCDDPSAVMRPFDAVRDGLVVGEGAAVFLLENRRHAESRGVRILARLLAWACCYQSVRNGKPTGREAIGWTIRSTLEHAGLSSTQIGHVNAHGFSTQEHDRLEARAICDVLPTVCVTAPKSYFGDLQAAAGAVELAVSVLSFQSGVVPATLNYERPDPECPLDVISGEPRTALPSTAVVVNWTDLGQAAAVIVADVD